MQRHMKVKAALAALAITGGAAVAVIGPASPALGFFSPPLLLEIHVNSPATLVAKGAAPTSPSRSSAPAPGPPLSM